jgi:hypothetical protein
MKIEIQEFENGLTVKELKQIIKDWPEIHENGEPTEVWISTNKFYVPSKVSSPVYYITPLTVRTLDDKSKTCHLLLESVED